MTFERAPLDPESILLFVLLFIVPNVIAVGRALLRKHRGQTDFEPDELDHILFLTAQIYTMVAMILAERWLDRSLETGED